MGLRWCLINHICIWKMRNTDLLNIPKPNVSQKPLDWVVLVCGLPQKVNLKRTGVNVILPSTVCWVNETKKANKRVKTRWIYTCQVICRCITLIFSSKAIEKCTEIVRRIHILSFFKLVTFLTALNIFVGVRRCRSYSKTTLCGSLMVLTADWIASVLWNAPIRFRTL